jgi:hypothetical protein
MRATRAAMPCRNIHSGWQRTFVLSALWPADPNEVGQSDCFHSSTIFTRSLPWGLRPSAMASCLERNVSRERATSIAPSPLQISQPNGRPGGPRRLVTNRYGDKLCIFALCHTRERKSDPQAGSDFKLIYNPNMVGSTNSAYRACSAWPIDPQFRLNLTGHQSSGARQDGRSTLERAPHLRRQRHRKSVR